MEISFIVLALKGRDCVDFYVSWKNESYFGEKDKILFIVVFSSNRGKDYNFMIIMGGDLT